MSFDPVEIEIRMRQNVDEESKKAGKGMSDVGSAAKQAQLEVTESIQIQKQVIQQLKAELEPLSAAFKKANQGTQDPAVYAERKRLLGLVREMKAELKGEEDALISLENQTTKFTAKTANLETEIRNVRNEMAALKMAGKDESATYKELEQRLGILGTAYKELTAKQKALSTGGTQMAGFVSGIQALSGALTAGAGAIGLFNSDSEKMQEIQTRVQSLMAITIGLQQVGNTLHSTSAFRVTTVAAAKNLWAAANLRVAATLGISNIAAKALMATLTLGLSVAITAVIFLIDKYVTNSRKAAEETKKFNEVMSGSLGDMMVSYEKLKSEYKALNNNIEAQKKFVLENKKAFDSLGIAVNDVNDAERLFSTSGTVAFVEAMKQRSIAVANMELASEKYKEYIALNLEADTREKSPTNFDKLSSSSGWQERDGKRVLRNNSAVEAADKIRTEAKTKLNEFNAYVDGHVAATNKAAEALNKANLTTTTTIADNSKAYWESQKKEAQKSLDQMTDLEKGSEKWNAALSKFKEANTKLEVWDFSSKKEKKLESDKEKAADKLRKMAVDTEEQIAAATIAAMQDGANKKLAETKADYDKRINIIKEKRLELAELEKATGTPATAQRKQLDTLESSETDKYNAINKAINDAAALEIAKIWDDVDKRFRTQLENQLADVDRYYAEQLAKLKANITDKDQLQIQSGLLERKRQNEKAILVKESELDALHFLEEIDLQKQELANKSLKWETDKREALLKIQLDAAKKQLQKQLEIQLAGGDNARQIEILKQKIIELSGQIAEIPTDKFKEIVGILSNALSQMSAVGGELGSVFSSLSGSVNNIATSLSKTASTGDKISAGVSGLMSLYSLVSDQIEQNKRKQEEWNAAIKEAAHDAQMARIELEAYQESNLFGIENPYAKAIAGAKQYSESMKALTDAAAKLESGSVQTGTRKAVSGGNIAKGIGSGAAAGAAVGSIVPVIGTVIGAAVGAIFGGLVGLFSKKKVAVFASLKKQYGEIYDKDTFELNPKILQDYSKLDAATKALVDNWKEIKEKAKEAQDQMRQNFKDLAGDIGSSLANSLIDAFRNNDIYSAVNDFHDHVSKIIEDIVGQLIFAAHFQKFFDELEQRFNSSFEEGGDGSIVDDLMWFFETFQASIPAFNDDLASMQAAMAGLGYDIFSQTDETRSGTSKALSQASQSSIDELSGRILAMGRNVADIRNGNLESLRYEREASNYRKLISTQLNALIMNTTIANGFLNSMRDTLEDINTRGVKLKV